ncbi:MAG: alpha/beta hydrolase [Rothia sp. (in: high G+C Gram-positive bacteria)]|uniref:alpha/beta hydrolase n=1 Tax=Rothia sp. (in: high G+C Gram-positive bacteria) TaxID=1885016 RepID=UPI0026E02FD3|nr:alpha/beta hydrolase [Rothia sp. (in: high G+C Gram-positive bacteria)]MDO5750758.1 alpha/beta hydrolase [Rothia sp. (in: high G+C Gram-positive bacteria)]
MTLSYISGTYRPDSARRALAHPAVSIAADAFDYDFFPAVSSGDSAPLLIWVHGGAWRFGTNTGWRLPAPEPSAALSGPFTSGPAQALMRDALLSAGWALASINYRLSDTALFPAPLHDVKEAIRYFRAQAERFGIDPERIAIAGGSAGGHLSYMAAFTGGLDDSLAPELAEYYEGREFSEYPAVSSAVAAVGSFYGVSDLRSIFTDRPLVGLHYAEAEDDGAEWRLLGSDYPIPDVLPEPGLVHHGVSDHCSPLLDSRQQAIENWERVHPIDLARSSAVSPVPTFASHGISDPVVPYIQSLRVDNALRARGVHTRLHLVPGAVHADGACFSAAIIEDFVDFLERVRL